jgi:hypothetical protein
MIGKVPEGRGGAPLLALEQQGYERCGEHETGGDFEAPVTDEMTPALPLGAVTDLIVVLQIAEGAVAREAGGRPAVPTVTKARVAAVVDERVCKGLRQVGQRAKVLLMPGAFAGEHGVQGVVKVVAPLCREAVAADFGRPHHPRVVQVALGDEHGVASELGRERLDFSRQLLKEVDGRGVDEGVDGIETQAVVGGVDEPLQPLRTATGAVGRVQIDAVIAPGMAPPNSSCASVAQPPTSTWTKAVA